MILNWSAHAQSKDYVTEQTLIMLYYSFACSRVSYDVIVWGTAADKYLEEVETKLCNTVRTIMWNKKSS